MSVILQTSLQMFHSNPCLHALVFKQNSLISCYIITSIHLPLKPREWFCCPGLEKNMTSIHFRNFRQFQGVGSFQLKKKISWVISFGQSNSNSISQFPSLLQVFFNNAELFKSTYPCKLQFILYQHLFKLKMKTKFLTFCPKFHLCFQSLFFTRISNLKSIWIPYPHLLTQKDDILSESVSFVSSHHISKLSFYLFPALTLTFSKLYHFFYLAILISNLLFSQVEAVGMTNKWWLSDM